MIETFEFFIERTDLLDSMEIHPLGLYNNTGSYRAFHSHLSKYPEKYGYDISGGILNDTVCFDWKNEHIKFKEAFLLAEKYSSIAANTRNKIIAQEAFFLAGLGTELESFQQPLNKDFDWNIALELKEIRSRQYAKTFHRSFGIPKMPDGWTWRPTND
jgi:hypothetical protein